MSKPSCKSKLCFVSIPICCSSKEERSERRPKISKPIRDASAVIQATQGEVSVEEARGMVTRVSDRLQPKFHRIDQQTQGHLRKILDAMHKQRVSSSTFLHADGYGHSDYGRDVLDAVYADIFCTESAMVRIQFMSGTHAIASVLYGVLRPGDEVLSITGRVYDTLEQVLGTTRRSEQVSDEEDDVGNLKDFGITTRILPLLDDGTMNYDGIYKAMNSHTKIIFIQRSFGYDWRPPVTIEQIGRAVRVIKRVRSDVIVFVDNCYGEFVEDKEPTHTDVGADVMAGSLIKNLGGGLVPSGGYVVGRADIINKAKARLSAPGVGGGATLGYLKPMFQGLFMAPGVIGEALKSSLLIAEVMHSELGYDVMPHRHVHSFVRSVKLNDRQKLIDFCKAVQRNGPVGAFIHPTVGQTDGYEDEVVFAQSTFVDGSTIELSADGAVRPPFAAFAQGGLHWTHWSIVLEDVIHSIGRCDQPRCVEVDVGQPV